MEYRVVPMAEKHLPALAELERACFSHPWSEGMLREELTREGGVFFVAEGPGGAVLGYAGVETVLDEGYITNVAVGAPYRRQGIAGALVAALAEYGRGRLAFLTLEVRASNAPAMALYHKYGFVQVGRRKNYYDAPREDAILMKLEFEYGTETD